MASRKYQGGKFAVSRRMMGSARSSRNVGRLMKGVGYLGAISTGINAASGNAPLALGTAGLSLYALARRDYRVREAESLRLKSRAVDSILNKARTGNTLGIKRSGKRADAGGGARLALAKAAATRTAVAQRTNNMGVTGRRVAAAAPSRSNGAVKAYTRMLNGQAVFVSGYSRTV